MPAQTRHDVPQMGNHTNGLRNNNHSFSRSLSLSLFLCLSLRVPLEQLQTHMRSLNTQHPTSELLAGPTENTVKQRCCLSLHGSIPIGALLASARFTAPSGCESRAGLVTSTFPPLKRRISPPTHVGAQLVELNLLHYKWPCLLPRHPMAASNDNCNGTVLCGGLKWR